MKSATSLEQRLRCTNVAEIKALDKLSGKEEAQVLNYLKAMGLRVGVLINFGSHPKMKWKRLVK